MGELIARVGRFGEVVRVNLIRRFFSSAGEGGLRVWLGTEGGQNKHKHKCACK